MHSPHDRLFRRVFSDPEQAAGEIRLLLPSVVGEAIDWTTLRLQPGSFVDEALEERRSDVLFRADLRGREVLLYLLLEHQSTADPLMPWRLLQYMVRIWDRHLQEHPDRTRLPAIVPLVVHHSEGGWNAPTLFEEIVDLSADLLTALRAYLPSFALLLDDLSTERDEALRGRVLIPALGRLALVLLKGSGKSPNGVKELRRSAALVTEVAEAPNGVAALSALVRYLLEVSQAHPAEFGAFFRELGPKVEAAYMTGADILRAEGEARGEARGAVQREALAVQRILERRGILLSGTHIERLWTCSDLSVLEAWFDRAFTVKSADELFG